jgi:hypothetical protein
MSEANMPSTPPVVADGRLDWRLFVIVSLIMVVLTSLFVVELAIQWQDYRSGIRAALAGPVQDHAAALSYSRALDAAIVKTAALFLGYLLVFTGALYVLRTASIGYSIAAKTGSFDGSLQTSSPGLVIITLGVFLVAVTILTRSDVNYEGPMATTVGQEERDSGGPTFEPSPTLPATVPPSERKK